ncbi:MAG: Uncharacterized protein JWR60_3974 [Polaromonas sp.]|nr:Uncharacterized protein [Polaromonas sp.]
MMIQEDVVHLALGGHAAQRGTQFFHLAEVVAKAYEPTLQQLDKLDRAYEDTGNFLIGRPEFADFLTGVHPQGSRELGTIVRPLDPTRDGFDIDLVAKFSPSALSKYKGGQGARLLMKELRLALDCYVHENPCKKLSVRSWDRCVTFMYEDGMQADFVPVIGEPQMRLVNGAEHGLIPDTSLDSYLSTNPKGYCQDFHRIAQIKANFPTKLLDSISMEARKAELDPLSNATEVLGRLICRYVQLAKVHRNIAFSGADENVIPTSVFLTSLIARGYEKLALNPHDGPLELFVDIVNTMPELFEEETLNHGRRRWLLMNPCARNDNLAESMNTTNRQEAFMQWHDRLQRDLGDLVISIQDKSSSQGVLEVVKTSFGVRAATALLTHNANRRDALRAGGKASFFVGGSAVATTTSSRRHTFFGRSW